MTVTRNETANSTLILNFCTLEIKEQTLPVKYCDVSVKFCIYDSFICSFISVTIMIKILLEIITRENAKGK